MIKWLTICIFCLFCSSAKVSNISMEASKTRHSKIESPLRVSFTYNQPFLYRSDKTTHFKGIEYKLLQTIAEKLNLNLSLEFNEEIHRFQPVFNKSDILAGGLIPFLPHSDNVVASRPYYQDDLTWCIQKAKYFPFVFNLPLAMSPTVWILLIFGIGYSIGMILYIMIQFDLKYEKRNHRDWHYTTWLIALPAVIGISQRFYPKSLSLRLFYGYILITMIFVWQIVMFEITSYLIVPVQRAQISTIEDIVYYDYRLAGSQESLRFLSFDDRYKKPQIDSFYVCPDINRCLKYLENNEYLAIAVSRQRILNSRFYSASKIYCFDQSQSINSYQPALLLRKHAKLVSSIDRIIRNAFEGGLFVKWNRESQRKRRPLIPFKRTSVGLIHYSGVFLFVLVGGSMISTSTLLVERLIHRKMMQTHSTSIWTYLEQFFDGHRHYLINLTELLQKNGRV